MTMYPSEHISERGEWSIQRATIFGYFDACTGQLQGLLQDMMTHFRELEDIAWFGLHLSAFTSMVSGIDTFSDTNINILKLLALHTTATLAVEQLQSTQSSSGAHIHIYCDNISAISKYRTQRSNHPVYTYLFHLLVQLQLRNWCTIGTSYLLE